VSDSPALGFNHVALTVAPELLCEPGRAQIVAFYAAVFGWTELERLRVDGACLVLQCQGAAVYLVGGSPITACAARDHFGYAVRTLQELEHVLERAAQHRQRDARVEIVGHEVVEDSGVRVHNAYVRYRLPMWVEIQYFETRVPSPTG